MTENFSFVMGTGTCIMCAEAVSPAAELRVTCKQALAISVRQKSIIKMTGLSHIIKLRRYNV